MKEFVTTSFHVLLVTREKYPEQFLKMTKVKMKFYQILGLYYYNIILKCPI